MPSFLSGSQRGHTHVLHLRVQMEDTDAGGITYYANYLKFAERGRAAALAYLGYPHKAIIENLGIMFVVRKCTVDYLAPSFLDEDLEVVTMFKTPGRVKISVIQDIMRQGQSLVHLETVLACVDMNLRPAKIPGDLLKKIMIFSESSV